jgi:phosphatidate cytidylyltransferase
VRERAISSIGVVVVGLVPAVLGGPVFAVVFAALCLVGLGEWSRIAGALGGRSSALGYLVVAGFAIAALAGGREGAALGLAAAAVGLPLVEAALFRPRIEPAGALDWALDAIGTLYLGIPLFAAIALRQSEGTVEVEWLADLAGALSPGWEGAPRGLAWLLVVILVTWLNDTAAYLVGRSFGRRKLAPLVSPKKTVEGSIGGLVGAVVAGAIGVALFGLGVSPLVGALVGIVLGVVGQVGDLAESLVKRQAGVKDSGTLIRGHGGILDRLDAMLFALVAGWLLAPVVDRLA